MKMFFYELLIFVIFQSNSVLLDVHIEWITVHVIGLKIFENVFGKILIFIIFQWNSVLLDVHIEWITVRAIRLKIFENVLGKFLFS